MGRLSPPLMYKGDFMGNTVIMCAQPAHEASSHLHPPAQAIEEAAVQQLDQKERGE
jgi:hypothetical protein